MKIMVIYDSTFGNTKTIADTIAKELGNDVQALSVSDLKENSLDGIEFLVVGSPIIAWKPSERMGMFTVATSCGWRRCASRSKLCVRP